MDITKYIDDIADFPKPGIIFKDISRLLRDGLPELLDAMDQMIDWNEIDAIAGIDARGFILGAALAGKKNLGFIPIRKKGKLPPPIIQETYQLEYGTDTLEIKPAGNKGLRLLLIDDVLATGGTLRAARNLCNKAGHQVQAMLVLIDLKFLNTFEREGIEVKSFLQLN